MPAANPLRLHYSHVRCSVVSQMPGKRRARNVGDALAGAGQRNIVPRSNSRPHLARRRAGSR